MPPSDSAERAGDSAGSGSRTVVPNPFTTRVRLLPPVPDAAVPAPAEPGNPSPATNSGGTEPPREAVSEHKHRLIIHPPRRSVNRQFRAHPETAETPVDPSRRAFLLRGGILVAGLAAGAVLVRTGLSRLAELPRRFGILPPGAQDAERFAAKCTSCQLCTANCPEKIIVPAPGGTGPVSLDLNRGACRFNCNLCAQLCPTGAILPLTLKEKQHTKIAEAKFNPRNCIVFQEEEECGRCASVCPVRAITLRGNGTPRPVNTNLCIGCGACQAVCPAPEKAMTVHEIEKQITLPEPVRQ